MMLKVKGILALSLLFLIWVLSACGPTTDPVVETGPVPVSGEEASAEPVSLAQEAPVLPAEEAVDTCVSCHTDEQLLHESAGTEKMTAGEGAEEPWMKTFVSAAFMGTVHGNVACTECHGGVQDPDKELAHQGVIRNPSDQPEDTCGACHPDVVANTQHSLHANLAGFKTAVNARSTGKYHQDLENIIDENCSSCHATCGDCHVSLPAMAGGGFLDGHLFTAQPSMMTNCIACHESRSGGEFIGAHEGMTADVHLEQAGMSCTSCHSGAQLHGEPSECSSCHQGPVEDNPPPSDHRYAGVQNPSCESCHVTVATGQDEVIMHQMHGSNLSCQVCHATAYTNCEGCHIEDSAGDGGMTAASGETTFSFLIGKNPYQSYARPYEYVPVRHAPVSPNSFDAYQEGLLPNFDQVETWKYATPHNIQRNTPQTESCNACHGNPEWFLTADKVSSEEMEANQAVIVDEVPPMITSREQIPSR